MRHNKLNKRFGRNKSARKELIRSLTRNALIYSRIKTTLAKAKEVSRLLDRLISLGKAETLQARRAAFAVLQDRSLVSRLVKDIAPLFKNRKGGYSRIIQLNNRHGDGAQMAMLELVEKVKEEPKPKKAKAVKPKEKVKPEEEPKEEKAKKPRPSKEIKKPKAEKVKVAEKQPKIKEEPVPEKIKPKLKEEKAPKVEEEKHKKAGWLDRVKGIFKRKKD